MSLKAPSNEEMIKNKIIQMRAALDNLKNLALKEELYVNRNLCWVQKLDLRF